MIKDFKKSDLRTGMKVVYRDGFERIIMLNTESGDMLLADGTAYTIDLSVYTDSLTTLIRNLDIMKVYSNRHGLNENGYELIWEREEAPKVKELTMSEVNAEFGCECKIIDGGK